MKLLKSLLASMLIAMPLIATQAQRSITIQDVEKW